MPSTRKQKAKERRFRQLDMLSDVENVDIMLGIYSRDGEDNIAREKEMNLDSGSSRPQQNSNVIGEDFRSLLNTNSRENSEITIETTRMISEEISNQMSRKLNEIKNSLNSQIQEAIDNVMTEKVLPSIQNTLGTHGNVDYTTMDQESMGPHKNPRAANFALRDHKSSGPQRNSEVGNTQKSWENCPKKCFSQENSRQMSRQSSIDSNCSEQNHDKNGNWCYTPRKNSNFQIGENLFQKILQDFKIKHSIIRKSCIEIFQAERGLVLFQASRSFIGSIEESTWHEFQG